MPPTPPHGTSSQGAYQERAAGGLAKITADYLHHHRIAIYHDGHLPVISSCHSKTNILMHYRIGQSYIFGKADL